MQNSIILLEIKLILSYLKISFIETQFAKKVFEFFFFRYHYSLALARLYTQQMCTN